VQILDHGYREQYEKRSGKKGEWFTTKRRHLRRRQVEADAVPPAVAGRLWVNGEEVSSGAPPRAGYLCLESEGSPVEFKNIRIRELP
jgi:hypothetical protein